MIVAVAELLGMPLWFSATAAAPELAAEWGLTADETAWLTVAVQLGFVAGAGAVVAGSAADRLGRTRITGASMAISGVSCLAAGVLFGSSPALLVPFVLLWGFVIVADSAQFSAAASELAEESYVGTALTLRTAVGFLPTTVSIQLVPVVVDLVVAVGRRAVGGRPGARDAVDATTRVPARSVEARRRARMRDDPQPHAAGSAEI